MLKILHKRWVNKKLKLKMQKQQRNLSPQQQQTFQPKHKQHREQQQQLKQKQQNGQHLMQQSKQQQQLLQLQHVLQQQKQMLHQKLRQRIENQHQQQRHLQEQKQKVSQCQQQQEQLQQKCLQKHKKSLKQQQNEQLLQSELPKHEREKLLQQQKTNQKQAQFQQKQQQQQQIQSNLTIIQQQLSHQCHEKRQQDLSLPFVQKKCLVDENSAVTELSFVHHQCGTDSVITEYISTIKRDGDDQNCKLKYQRLEIVQGLEFSINILDEQAVKDQKLEKVLAALARVDKDMKKDEEADRADLIELPIFPELESMEQWLARQQKKRSEALSMVFGKSDSDAVIIESASQLTLVDEDEGSSELAIVRCEVEYEDNDSDSTIKANQHIHADLSDSSEECAFKSSDLTTTDKITNKEAVVVSSAKAELSEVCNKNSDEKAFGAEQQPQQGLGFGDDLEICDFLIGSSKSSEYSLPNPYGENFGLDVILTAPLNPTIRPVSILMQKHESQVSKIPRIQLVTKKKHRRLTFKSDIIVYIYYDYMSTIMEQVPTSEIFTLQDFKYTASSFQWLIETPKGLATLLPKCSTNKNVLEMSSKCSSLRKKQAKSRQKNITKNESKRKLTRQELSPEHLALLEKVEAEYHQAQLNYFYGNHPPGYWWNNDELASNVKTDALDSKQYLATPILNEKPEFLFEETKTLDHSLDLSFEDSKNIDSTVAFSNVSSTCKIGRGEEFPNTKFAEYMKKINGSESL